MTKFRKGKENRRLVLSPSIKHEIRKFLQDGKEMYKKRDARAKFAFLYIQLIAFIFYG